MADTLSSDLIDHLFGALEAMPAQERRRAHWVMNGEWEHECRKLAIEHGYTPPLRLSGPALLIGLPVEIRDDGGVPHLERETPPRR